MWPYYYIPRAVVMFDIRMIPTHDTVNTAVFYEMFENVPGILSSRTYLKFQEICPSPGNVSRSKTYVTCMSRTKKYFDFLENLLRKYSRKYSAYIVFQECVTILEPCRVPGSMSKAKKYVEC
jgi:hypothetical protein